MEEQGLCSLITLQNIRLGQPRVTYPSPFDVAGVERSSIMPYQKSKVLKLLEGGNAPGVRQCFMLGF